MTVQAYPGTSLGAEVFLNGLADRLGPACEDFAVGPVVPSSVSGREAGRRIVSCGRFKGDGMANYSLYFAIRGQKALYVLARTWRGEPFRTAPVDAAELSAWTATFDKVRLSD